MKRLKKKAQVKFEIEKQKLYARTSLILEKSISKLHALHQWIYSKTTLEKTPYHSLSPISTVNNRNEYIKALQWALNNREEQNIKNIALTGKYGSGKSSILRTFQEHNTNDELRFLNISLATFKEEKLSENSTETNQDESITTEDSSKPTGENLLRLLEFSILQQLFYTEDNKVLPDSRLRKIKSYSKNNLLVTACLSFIFIGSAVCLFTPETIYDKFKIDLSETLTYITHYVSLIIFLLGCFFLIFKSARTIHNIRLSKLSFQNAELEVGDKINKSILNHHLDEILYFFEVTKYNVVVIEDLDRFYKTEIFTKLREINLLINNSKKVTRNKGNIVFIYAVRDEMFKDSDRTKFFDYIIPVIPTINFSNSNEKVLKKLESREYNISEDLIDNISFFIDDMRLLHNIFNEFYIYRKELNRNQLEDNKLLAIIVYKNIYPNDFVDLGDRKGELYSIIHTKKKEYINQIVDLKRKEIEKIKTKIKELDIIKIKDVKELRRLYLYEYFIRLTYKVSTFRLNNNNYTPDNFLEEDKFEYLVNDEISHYYNNQYGNQSLNVNFDTIQNAVDSNYTYEEKVEQISDLSNNKINTLKKDIQKIESDIGIIKKAKISNILSNKDIEIKLKNESQEQLLNILIRNEYIDEDYIDYISIFHEGSTSKNDDEFRIRVKLQKTTDFAHPLDKIDKLIQKISISDFDETYILNYNLVGYLLNNKAQYSQHSDKVFHLLSNESEDCKDFIKNYVERGICTDLFIKELTIYWSNIWNYIENESDFTDEEKETYLKLIINHSDISSIQDFDAVEEFEQMFAKKTNINQYNDIKLKELITALHIKFQDLDISEISVNLLDFIYEGRFYEINPTVIKKLIDKYGNLNIPDFETKNYTAILNSTAKKLIEYVEENINEYIGLTYLKLKYNNQEREENYIALLNNEKIEFKLRLDILYKVETKIKTLSVITNHTLQKVFLERSKVYPSWEILIDYFSSVSRVIDEIITFINVLENAQTLSTHKITESKCHLEYLVDFTHALLTENIINNECYIYILNSMPTDFDSVDFEELDKEKVAALISKKIINLNLDNYTILKDNFDMFHIDLLLVRKNDFLIDIETYPLDTMDLLKLLKSDALTIEEKNTIISTIEESKLLNTNLLDLLGSFILQLNTFEVNSSLAKSILLKSKLSTNQKIEIFNIKYPLLDTIGVTEFLISLGEPYSDTTNKPYSIIPETSINKVLAAILDKEINYISSISENKKGIKLNTYRKEKEN